MKKLLLSVSALVLALGTGFAQTSVNSFVYDFSSTATGASNCLINCCQYSGMLWLNGDGTLGTDISKGTNNELIIGSDATTDKGGSGSQRVRGFNQGPVLLDIYRVVGNACAKMNDVSTVTGGVINMSTYKKVKITAKASAPMNLRLELGKGTSSATNVDANICNFALTTNYQDLTFDYNGKFAGFDSTSVSTIRFKFNVGDANLATTGFTGSVTIASIKFGQAAEPSVATNTSDDEIIANQIAIYPNPATEKVTIDLSSLKSTASVKLLNTSGAVVSEISGANGSASFNVDGVAKGMYFVQISTDDKIIRKKIMVD